MVSQQDRQQNLEEIAEWIMVSFLEFMVYWVLFTILVNLCIKQCVVANLKKFQKI